MKFNLDDRDVLALYDLMTVGLSSNELCVDRQVLKKLHERFKQCILSSLARGKLTQIEDVDKFSIKQDTASDEQRYESNLLTLEESLHEDKDYRTYPKSQQSLQRSKHRHKR